MEYKCIKLPNYSTNLPALHSCCRPLKAAHKVQNPKNISKDAEFNWKKERSPCDQFYRATQTEDEDEEEG